MNGLASVHAVQNDGDMTVNGKLEVNGGGLVNDGLGTLTISGVTNVTGGVTAAGFGVIVNPGATLTADSYISVEHGCFGNAFHSLVPESRKHGHREWRDDLCHDFQGTQQAK